jgi:nucleoid DNA-binding protein
LNKRDFVKKVAESLGMSKRMAEYHVSFILDLAILEAERTGKLKIDSHVFYKRTISERTWIGRLNGIEYSTPTVHLVSYRNTKKFKNPERRKIDDGQSE